VGPVLCSTLIAGLPELGTLSRRRNPAELPAPSKLDTTRH
jgi:hypothetical protein